MHDYQTKNLNITNNIMETNKELFDILHKKGEGIFGKVHIIELDTYYDYEAQEFYGYDYRVYHADGYCFQVSGIRDLEEDSDENINGYYYNFDSDMFDGFKKIKNSEHAICLIKNYI